MPNFDLSENIGKSIVSPLSLNLIFSYLANRTQLVKIKTSYSDKSNIEYVVPQGSILGPLLFNIVLIDFFFECDDSEIRVHILVLMIYLA